MAGKNILVTGIGGNVGQGILRNLKNSKYNLRLIGSNVTDVSAGNHLCDVVYKLPYAYEKSYIDEMKDLCEKEQVDLIIPSTDYESLYLSKYRSKLPMVAACPYDTVRTCTDKLETYRYFSRFNVPFAESCLPSEYKGDYGNIIAKPREGRGSRNLHFNPSSWDEFSDEDYTIQKLYTGKEITTAFYVGLDGNLVGHISMDRTLVNGATTFCSVTHECDEAIEKMIRQMMDVLEIKGACNVQYILDEKGEVHPFEINCRISGTNSIRANFGFNDVLWTIEELLFQKSIEKPVIKDGSACRILMDVIFPDDMDLSKITEHSNSFMY